MSASTSTRPASSPTASCASTACACAPSCTRCSTRCPTMARATWRSSSRSACVKKVMASGRHDVRHAHRTLRVSRVSADRAAIVPLGGSADVPIGRGADMTQAQRLARMKLLAVGLLAAAAVLYAVASALEPRHIAWGFVAAFAEAAMIGAMADWFAVVALFCHPLGLPIPHTAIIPNNKARIGSNLANFICNNFLGTPQVLDKLRSFDPAAHLATWLAQPANAAKAGAHLVSAARYALSAFDDERVRDFIRRTAIARLQQIDVTQLAGQLLDVLTADRRHQALLDEVLHEVGRQLEDEDFQHKIAEMIAAEMDYLRWVRLDK